jgi:DNA-binding winged helix-turn-helix (wHTH) protein
MRVHFGEFVLDRATRQLLCGGEERHLETKAFQLLDLLLSRRPGVVSKREILEQLWPGTFVTESSLTGLVAQIRRVLDDDRQQSRFVRTVHGLGYAFSGEAIEETPARAGRGRRSAPRLVSEQEVFALRPGENVLGRDEDVTVRIDAPGVSRHHARIVVTEDQATLEDLGSKNGTYLRGERLKAPAVLADGDALRLGSQHLVFRSLRRAGSTLTEA